MARETTNVGYGRKLIGHSLKPKHLKALLFQRVAVMQSLQIGNPRLAVRIAEFL